MAKSNLASMSVDALLKLLKAGAKLEAFAVHKVRPPRKR
jgi:hypothetical protein